MTELYKNTTEVDTAYAQALKKAAQELGEFTVKEIATEGERYSPYFIDEDGEKTVEEIVLEVEPNHVALEIGSIDVNPGVLYTRANEIAEPDEDSHTTF